MIIRSNSKQIIYAKQLPLFKYIHAYLQVSANQSVCMQVEEELLKDPFKKAIPKDSKLLAYGPQSDKDNEEVESRSLTPVERAGVIGFAVTMTLVLLYCLKRNTTWRPWNSFVPNLKSFTAYQRASEKKNGRNGGGTTPKKSSTEKAAEAPASPPPDQLALLSTAV